MTRNLARLIAHLFVIVILITLVAAKPVSRAPHKARVKLAKPSAHRLVVHEWGTFTAIAGRDGNPVEWRPLVGPSDLPSFVYDLGSTQGGRGLRHGDQCFKCSEALIRMETPVLYFYADREMTVSVRLNFLNGTITEWYPQARVVYKGEPTSTIDWGRVMVLPGAATSLPVESKASHYYAARDTDAALVRACSKQEQQYEKFLFYRGLGDVDLPLTVKLEGDRLAINNAGSDHVATCIVFESRDGQIGYRIGKLRAGELTIERPTLDQTQTAVERELVTLLTGEGLYEKEARAMVATWRDSWFEDGLRLFYVVPRALTDKTLPLTLEPAPAELVRVLVGRTEIITPEMEQLIQKQLEPLNDASADLHSITMQLIRTHGRFAEPILKEMIEKTGDERWRNLLRQVIHSAHAALD